MGGWSSRPYFATRSITGEARRLALYRADGDAAHDVFRRREAHGEMSATSFFSPCYMKCSHSYRCHILASLRDAYARASDHDKRTGSLSCAIAGRFHGRLFTPRLMPGASSISGFWAGADCCAHSKHAHRSVLRAQRSAGEARPRCIMLFARVGHEVRERGGERSASPAQHFERAIGPRPTFAIGFTPADSSLCLFGALPLPDTARVSGRVKGTLYSALTARRRRGHQSSQCRARQLVGLMILPDGLHFPRGAAAAENTALIMPSADDYSCLLNVTRH